MNTTTIIGAIVVIIILLAGGAYLYTSAHAKGTTSIAQSGPSNSRVAYTISDAAASSVSSVNLQVQSVQMQSAATGQWYTATMAGSGSYKLQGQASYTLMANATVPAGTYDAVQMNISSATATYANGTTEAMAMVNSTVRAKGNFVVQSTANTTSTNWVNFDVKANQSTHTTASGRAVLLPVVDVVAWTGAQLTTGAGGAITVQNAGSATVSVSEGMDLNGTMMANFVLPQTANLSVIGGAVVSLG